jgi:hypothetical protein
MDFKCADPDQILSLLEGHEDVLSSTFEEEANKISKAECPHCGNRGATPVVDPETPFVEGKVLQDFRALCSGCGETYHLAP